MAVTLQRKVMSGVPMLEWETAAARAAAREYGLSWPNFRNGAALDELRATELRDERAAAKPLRVAQRKARNAAAMAQRHKATRNPGSGSPAAPKRGAAAPARRAARGEKRARRLPRPALPAASPAAGRHREASTGPSAPRRRLNVSARMDVESTPRNPVGAGARLPMPTPDMGPTPPGHASALSRENFATEESFRAYAAARAFVNVRRRARAAAGDDAEQASSGSDGSSDGSGPSP